MALKQKEPLRAAGDTKHFKMKGRRNYTGDTSQRTNQKKLKQAVQFERGLETSLSLEIAMVGNSNSPIINKNEETLCGPNLINPKFKTAKAHWLKPKFKRQATETGEGIMKYLYAGHSGQNY